MEPTQWIHTNFVYCYHDHPKADEARMCFGTSFKRGQSNMRGVIVVLRLKTTEQHKDVFGEEYKICTILRKEVG